jgi:hypothetical protein
MAAFRDKSFLQIVEERATLNVAVRVLLWENVEAWSFDAKDSSLRFASIGSPRRTRHPDDKDALPPLSFWRGTSGLPTDFYRLTSIRRS